MNFDDYDIERQVLDFMGQNGIYPARGERLIFDGQRHRLKLSGDKSGEKSGAYKIYTDNLPAGWVQDWHLGDPIKWHYDTSALDDERRKYFADPKIKAQTEALRKAREAAELATQNKAADTARIRFETLPPAPENFPYLQKKQVYPYGVKLDTYNNTDKAIAIPLRDIRGNVRSIQWILADGGKRFFPDAPLSGLFWAVGLDTANPSDFDEAILLGEGFATMAKVYELTDRPCVAGLFCSHLKNIASVLHTAFPKAKIIVMADNDKATELKRDFNPGVDAAKQIVKAGLAVDFIAPDFANPADGTDWDDFALIHGDEATASVLQGKINLALIPPDVKLIMSKVSSINAQDLRHKIFPPVLWAVDGFLPEGLSILAGGPKVGKSILALHLAVGVAIGGCVLGKINVLKGQVLYLALEDTQRRIQDRINSGDFAYEDNIDLSALDIVTEIPRQNIGGTLYIEWWLSTHKNARLVIIDTLQMFRKLLTGKGSMYSEDYEAISSIKKIADTYGVAILVIHHLKKGMEGDWLSEISGSQGISGAADTIFSLKRERNSTLATLHRTGRDVEEKDFIMKLDGLGWTLQDDAEAFTMPEWKRQILDIIKVNGSITPIQLSEAHGLNINTAKTNLRRLVQDGSIKKTGYGTYGLPEN